MYLSKRLQRIADLVDEGSVLADIGCGHAKVSLYCLQQGIVSRAIAVDCSAPTLASARAAAERMGLPLDCRLGDGLRPLGQGEADLAVIAGMGGNEMVSILSQAAFCMPTLILVPQKNVDLVRKYLFAADYRIVYDAVQPDGKFWYQVIKAVATPDTHLADPAALDFAQEARWYVGQDNRDNPYFAQYRAERIARLREIVDKGCVESSILHELFALQQWQE